MIIRIALPFVLVLLAGCARSEEANLMPADANGSTRDRRDRAARARRRGAGARRLARDAPGRAARARIRPRRRAALVQHRAATRAAASCSSATASTPAGDLPVMLVSVGSETRRLAVTSGEGPLPMLRASLHASDVLVAGLSRAAAPIVDPDRRFAAADPAAQPADRHLYRRSARLARCRAPAAPRPRNEAAPANDAGAGRLNRPAPAGSRLPMRVIRALGMALAAAVALGRLRAAHRAAGAPPVPPPLPAPAPPPPPRPRPPPPPVDWQDGPLSPGDWSYDPSAAAARDLRVPERPLFAVACDGRAAGQLSRASAPPRARRSSFAPPLASAACRGRDHPRASRRLAASDPLLDQIGVQPRPLPGPRPGGLPDLVLPTWPELARVIEDCRGQ